MLKRLAIVAILGLTSSGAPAQVFQDGFETVTLSRLFPLVEGRPQLPPGPLATQLDWFLDELAQGEATTAVEVEAHFTTGWLTGTLNAASTASFINTIRNSYPDGYVSDVVTATPVRFVALLRTPASNNVGFLQFGTRYADSQLINQLGLGGASNSVQFPVDQNLTLAQAADKFTTLSSGPGLLVARIDAQGQCQVIQERNADQLRATASVFKTWILAGLARSIATRALTPNDAIVLSAADIAPSGTINVEPLGTSFSALDMARLMMGISDNTATDHLHTLVGRAVIDEAIAASGVADPAVLQPLLNINEQFHVFRSLSEEDADAYAFGDEAYQYGYLPTLEALGPLTGNPPNFWVDLLVDGTWRATPRDVCQAFAHLRKFRGDALRVVDEALGASAGQPHVRNLWDRVWYKGGSLARATNQNDVWTHAWMLERNGEDPLVLVSLSNSATGGISGNNNFGVDNDIFDIQSINGRILQLLSEL